MVAYSSRPRLDPHPTQLIDRSKTLLFEFDGRVVQAHKGDTVASALYASGVRTFSRSFKYHRSRGLLCVAGRCPNCMMTVDSVPNVRTCMEPVRSGMSVRSQNAWPSLEHDALSALDRFDWALPVGFYYKALHRPKLLWELASPVIRRIAGLGSLPTEPEDGGEHYVHEYRHTDVAVVGGGSAGMSAALSAAESGAEVVLVDDQTSLGGSLRFDTRMHDNLPGVTEKVGYSVGAGLAQEVEDSPKIEILSNATAFGLYEDNYLGVLSGNVLTKLRAKSVVVATGTQEMPGVFEKNDLPGIILTSGLQRLVHLYGVNPGSSALMTTSTDAGYHAAADLMRLGVRIAAVADSRPDFPEHLEQASDLQSEGVLILTSHAASRAEGGRRVLGGVVAQIVDGRLATEERQFDCDLIAMSGGYQPASWLLEQTGAAFSYDHAIGERVPRELPRGVFAAGEVTGTHELRELLLQGRQAGTEAAGNALGASTVNGQWPDRVVSATASPAALPPLGIEHGARRFVCFCEDVTAKDIEQGVEEGFEDIQTLKRYSTVTMGPCQGKMCLKTFSRMTAELTGSTVDEIGVTTARPPAQPVPLGALAGPSHIPVKRTSLFPKHVELGAEIIDMSPWQRAFAYGDPQDECIAVRQRVGIIDVSTLGKIDVQGSDAPALLDKIYTHRFSDLRPGRVRYGIICSDDGTIIDDGTVARIADDHYFVTTSTGNIEMVEEWMKWWMAGTGMCVHVTNVTSGYAAINIAGPRARETLAKLADVDLAPDKFRYMRFKQGDVAGVPTMFLRIGFVGESSWELHFPAEYGEYMWDALMEAGREFEVSPFGVEAQRILRLEKKHIIVTQDTDAVTNPLEAGSAWAVKFDKEDFIGRGGIAAAQERGLEKRLVGFIMRDGTVPDDGDPVVVGDTPIGRVTSSRMSPTMGKGFGLAMVPNDVAEEQREIFIRVGRQNFPATITLEPFYDPEGKRLRS